MTHLTECRSRTLHKVRWVLFFMKLYRIKSPSGATYNLTADSIYHAIQRAKKLDNHLFAEQQYFKLNKL